MYIRNNTVFIERKVAHHRHSIKYILCCEDYWDELLLLRWQLSSPRYFTLSPPNFKMSFGTAFTFSIHVILDFRRHKYIVNIKYSLAYDNGLNITEKSEVPAQTPPFKGGV